MLALTQVSLTPDLTLPFKWEANLDCWGSGGPVAEW